MKLQMKREALQKLERQANELKTPLGTVSGTVAQAQRVKLKFIWHSSDNFAKDGYAEQRQML
jgi:hypothetical protein